jgi:hypothetical protein
VLWSERWCLHASIGVYGRKGTIGALRTWRGLWRTFYPLVFILGIFGLQHICPHYRLVLMISLLTFFFLVR